MNLLAARLGRIKPSMTVSINIKANALRAQGKDVLVLAAGEPDFDTPLNIREAAKKAMDEGETRYVPGRGTPNLQTAIINKFKKDNNISYSKEEIMVGVGGKHIIYNAMMATLNPKDEVIIPSPFWVSYPDIVLLADGIPVIVKCGSEKNFKITPSQLEENITNKTKWLMLNSPSNPTGAVYTPEEIQAIVELAIEHDLWIISDEIYARLLWVDWPHISPASIPGGAERTMVVTGFSKSFAMTGWRLGVLTGPKEAMKAAFACQANANSHVPTFLMPAASVALTQDEAVDEFCIQYVRRRSILMEGIDSIPGMQLVEPEGAFYAFIDITSSGMTSIEFADRALAEARVQLIPGSLIEGGEGFVRVSYATDEADIREGIARLKAWLS